MLGLLALATAGLPLLLLPSLPSVLGGLALIGAGTFFAQASATGFVGRAATSDRGASVFSSAGTAMTTGRAR